MFLCSDLYRFVIKYILSDWTKGRLARVNIVFSSYFCIQNNKKVRW